MKLTDFIQVIGRHMDEKYTKEARFSNLKVISSEERRKKTLRKCLVMEPYSQYYVYKVVNSMDSKEYDLLIALKGKIKKSRAILLSHVNIS